MKQKNKFNVGNKNKLSNHNFIQYNHSEILTEHTSSMVQRKLINNYNNSFKDKVIDNKYFNNNGNIGYFNDNKTENNILRSKEDDKYFLAGANSPKFTSFYFKSKNRNFRRKQENNPYSFISNNIQEFSKEIIDNTSKVNKNKEILQKIREKYIKTIYEKINSILFNEKLNFLCSFYGSSISGLSIENSDVDIMVKLKKDKNDNNFNYIRKVMDIIVYNLGKSNIN
jgi:predicted nucleotidyltransferase